MNYFRIAGVALNSITDKNLTQGFRAVLGFEKYVAAVVASKVLEKGFFPKVATGSKPNSMHYRTHVIGIPVSEHWRLIE